MVTEDCNFNCRYCYQSRKADYMPWETARSALDFFLPHLERNGLIYFFGGEPLLAFDLIRDLVIYLESLSKGVFGPFRLALATNGSLVDDRVLDFLEAHHFLLEVSFDGFAQDQGRQRGSFQPLIACLKRIMQRKNISLVVNSLFLPGTVKYLCRSASLLRELGIKKTSLSLDLTRPWPRPAIRILSDQLSELGKQLETDARGTGGVPIALTRDKKAKSIWRCPAGARQMTLTPGGTLWGCPGFYEYFKGKENQDGYRDFSFGFLPDFMKDPGKKYRQVLSHYRRFRMDNFYTARSRCFLCPRVTECAVCPVIGLPGRSSPFFVPAYLCRINQVIMDTKMSPLSP